ncbi:MAG: hypothetical protein KAU46_09390 [Candidatus Aminicenantes bacterium]|nr:hypothetical protein [Candidatus Aminicenantes bacterium]
MLQVKPDFFMYVGVAGLLISLFFFLFFIYRRIRWLIHKIKKKAASSPKLVASLRNLLLILMMTSVSGMVLFMGFFFRAYQAFTYEQLVAEVITQESKEPNTSLVTLLQYSSDVPPSSDEFLIKGDQWMLEGDILKWDNWLNFLGLHTRYRLTRLRGRYIQAEDEKKKETTLFSLVKDENHPLWRYLYKKSYRLPFVSTVYGNASYQVSGKDKHFLIYVSTSGFVVREKPPKKEDVIS